MIIIEELNRLVTKDQSLEQVVLRQLHAPFSYQLIMMANFIIVTDKNTNRFRILKNRITGIDEIHPLNKLNEFLTKIMEYSYGNI